MGEKFNPFEIDRTGIMERKNGTFRARASYTNPVTKEKVIFDKSFPTAFEAYEARKTFLSEMERRGHCSKYRDYKFDDVFWEHLENSDYKPATIKRKKSLYNQHIQAVFGDRRINRISAGELDDFLMKLGKPTVDKKFGKKIVYSQEYIAGFYKFFTALFGYAFEHEYVDRDVTKQMKKRRPWYRSAKKKKEGRYLSPEELAVIAEELEGSNLYTSFMIAIHTGLRKSEIFGLLWEDVDFDNKILKVSKQLLKNEENKIWDLVSLKTDNSERVVPMPEILVSYLKKLKEEQKVQKRKLGKYYRRKPAGYIDQYGGYSVTTEFDFVNVKSTGEYLNSDSTTYATRKFEKTTGKHRFLLDPNDPDSSIDFSYHDFRHPYVKLKLKFLLTQHYRCISAKVLDFPLNFKPVVGVNIHFVYEYICECLCQGVFLFHCFCCLQSF